MACGVALHGCIECLVYQETSAVEFLRGLPSFWTHVETDRFPERLLILCGIFFSSQVMGWFTESACNFNCREWKGNVEACSSNIELRILCRCK